MRVDGRGRRPAHGWIVVGLTALLAAGNRAPMGPTFIQGSCSDSLRMPPQIDASWVRCGTVTVPQDRDHPDARLAPVILPVVIFSAPGVANRTPILFLAGGPGEPAVDVVAEVFLATPAGQLLVRDRPVIAFNQRGIGSAAAPASPDLGVLSYRWRATRDESIATIVDSARRMTTRLRAAGYRPEFFTTLRAVDDVPDVVRALGFDRVVLFAASYGTRVALQVMRRHPDVVASAVLDGVAPPDHPELFDPEAVAARRRSVAARVVEDCESDAACRAEYGDLRSLASGLANPAAPPLHFRMRLPSMEGWIGVELSGRDVLSVLGAYASEYARSMIPQLLEEFARGDSARRSLSPQLALRVVHEAAVAKAAGPNYPLVYHVVLCGDVPAGVLQAGGRGVCDALHVPFGGPDAVAPVRSDIPTLLVSSAYDAQTPPELAEEAAQRLSHSRRVHFAGIGHVAYARPVAASCVAVIVSAFLNNPSQDPPDACAAALTPSFLPRSSAASFFSPR